MTEPINVGVFFGGRSVEHEVSVITAQQAIAAMPAGRMTAVPIYIAKSGAWYTGAPLLELERYRDIDRLIAESTRVTMHPEPGRGGELIEAGSRRGLLGGAPRTAARFDVALPLIHGSNGEDGTLQGLLELAGVAYCGCGVAAAAVSMDKRLARTTLRGAGVPVLDDAAVSRARWRDSAEAMCVELEAHPGYPMYVKPRNLGSSIGVVHVVDRRQLLDALDLAFRYDADVLAEPALEGIVEINCSVLGAGDDVRVSVCEQPVSSGTLSYADKYLSGGKGKSGAKAPADGYEERAAAHPGAHPGGARRAHPGRGGHGLPLHRRGRGDARGFPGQRGTGIVCRQRAQHGARLTRLLSLGGVRAGLPGPAAPSRRPWHGAAPRAAGDDLLHRHVAAHRKAGLTAAGPAMPPI